MAARRFKTYTPKSKASKPKHKNWDRLIRFMGGHDAGCMALLPEALLLAGAKDKRRPRPKVGVYRASSFGLTREDRIVSDALFLLNHGYCGDLHEAFNKALENNPKPEYDYHD